MVDKPPMELLLISLISAFVAMLGAAGGWFLGSQAGRRAVVDGQAGVVARFDALQVAMGNLAGQVAENMERSNVAVQRVSSERANIERRKRVQDTPPTMSEADYLAHLNKGGAALPDVERALGLMP